MAVVSSFYIRAEVSSPAAYSRILYSSHLMTSEKILAISSDEAIANTDYWERNTDIWLLWRHGEEYTPSDKPILSRTFNYTLEHYKTYHPRCEKNGHVLRMPTTSQSENIFASHFSSQPVMVTGWLVSGIVYDLMAAADLEKNYRKRDEGTRIDLGPPGGCFSR